MDKLAIYIGYVVLFLLGIFLILLLLFAIYDTISAIYQIATKRLTIFYFKKLCAKQTYEVAKEAVTCLKKMGAHDSNTIEEIKFMIERFRKNHRLEGMDEKG